MDSQSPKLAQESSEMVQAASPSADTLPASFDTLSLIPSSLRPFDYLPNELLDPIVANLAGEADSLQSLALVSKRFYGPTRQQSQWIISDIKHATRFLHTILTSPVLTEQVRHLHFSGNHRLEAEETLPLRSGLLPSIVEQCSSLRYLHVGGLHGDLAGQLRLVEAVGRLQHLAELEIGFESRREMPLPFLPSLYPVFNSLRNLTIGLSGSERFDWSDRQRQRPPRSLLPAFPPRCTIKDVSLRLESLLPEELHSILSTLTNRPEMVSIDISEKWQSRGRGTGSGFLSEQDIISLLSALPLAPLRLRLEKVSNLDATAPLPLPPLSYTAISILGRNAPRDVYVFFGPWVTIRSMV